MEVEDLLVRIAHIGLPKTASSYLQKHIFPILGPNYFTTYNNQWHTSLEFIRFTNKIWLEDFYKSSNFTFQQRCAYFYNTVDKYIDTWRDSSLSFGNNMDSFFLSAEGLAGFHPAVTNYAFRVIENCKGRKSYTHT